MKQKLLTLLLIAFIPIAMMAYDVEVDGIYYNLNTSDNTASVTKKNGNSYSGTVTIPASFEYNGTSYSVTSIGYLAFQGCSGLTSVTIPEGVTNIGFSAFSGCTSLTSVTIPEGVTRIESSTFEDCSGLTSVTIPSSVTDIESNAFSGCVSLTSVKVKNPRPIDFLDSDVFPNRTNITLYVPYGTKSAYQAADGWNEFKEIIEYRIEQTLSMTEIPSMTYGANFTLPSSTTKGRLAITWTSNNTNVATINGNTLTTTGTGCATITATQEGNNAYAPFYKEYTITVTKAPLTITAKSYTITQGDPLPEFEATYSGFKNNETASVLTNLPVFSCSATSSDNLGTYAITPSGAEARNYEINYEEGTLTIKNIIITANSYYIKYGDAIPTLEYTHTGTTLNGSPVLSCEATSSSPVGTYDIIVSQGTIPNEVVTCVNGKLTITKAPLTIKAQSYLLKRGEPLPSLEDIEITYEDFKNGEDERVLTSLPTVSCEATDSNVPGCYPITLSGAEADNYYISYIEGKLYIMEDGVILPWGQDFPWEMKYVYQDSNNGAAPTNDANGKAWYEVGYDDSAWETLAGPISGHLCNYLRRTFNINLSDNLSEYVCLQCFHECDVVFYINGKEVISWPFDGGDVHVGKIPIEAFVEGTNTLAIYINNFIGDAYFDYTLFDHAAITIPEEGVTTYCPSCDLDFSGVTDFKAYVAASYSNGTVFMKQVDSAPAGTGLYLQGTPGYYSVPFKTTTKYEHNLLVGTPYTYGAVIGGTEGNKTNLVLERFFNEHWEDPPAEPMSHGKKRVSTQVKGNTNFYPITWHLNDMPANSAWLQLPTSICTVEEVSVGFLEDESSPDLNKDGRVTVTDVMMLVKKVLNN